MNVLYERYMAAAREHAVHSTTCTACQADATCASATRLLERFSRLQDAYNTQLAQNGENPTVCQQQPISDHITSE